MIKTHFQINHTGEVLWNLVKKESAQRNVVIFAYNVISIY